MADETLELTDSFVVVAVRHRLLNAKHAEEIVEQAKQEKTAQADAALTLAYLTPQEVDAVQLLMRPDSLVPGYRLTGLVGCPDGAIGYRFHVRVMLGAGSSIQIVLPHPVRSELTKNLMAVSVLLEKGTARVVPTEPTSVSGRRGVEGTKKVSLRPGSPDEKPAQEVYVYRQADDLILIVNGTLLARFTRTPATKDEITLKVVRGRSSFADIAVDGLVEPRTVSRATFIGSNEVSPF